jgi:hypothetical protein
MKKQKLYYWYGVIYKITNLTNKKCYIGQTTNGDYIKYIKNHFKFAFRNKDEDKKYLYKAIRKYGKENFKWEILGFCYSREELNEAEIDCIEFYRSFVYKYENIYGYNLTKGGEGGNGRFKVSISTNFLRFIIDYFYYDVNILSLKKLLDLFSLSKYGRNTIHRELKEKFPIEYKNIVKISRSRLSSGINNGHYNIPVSQKNKNNLRKLYLGSIPGNKKKIDYKKLIDLYFLNMFNNEIAKQMNLSLDITMRRLKELNLPSFQQKRKKDKQLWINSHSKEEFYAKIPK